MNPSTTYKDNWSQNAKVIYKVMVKPYTLKDLCVLYNTTYKVLSRWLLPFHHLLGSRNGRFYSVLQVEIIFAKLGIPYEIKEVEG